MIDMDDFMPIIIGFIAAGILFYSFVIFVKKTLRAPSAGHVTTEYDRKLREQKWQMRDVRARQKQLMRDQKQKLRDMQYMQRR